MARQTRRGGAIGLYVGNRTITAVQIRSTPAGVEILARGAVEMPQATIENAVVVNPGRLGQAIRSLWNSMGLMERAAELALPPVSYSMRALRFPDLPARERRSIVRGELEQTGVLPIGGESFDFLWLEGKGTAQADAYA